MKVPHSWLQVIPRNEFQAAWPLCWAFKKCSWSHKAAASLVALRKHTALLWGGPRGTKPQAAVKIDEGFGPTKEHTRSWSLPRAKEFQRWPRASDKVTELLHCGTLWEGPVKPRPDPWPREPERERRRAGGSCQTHGDPLSSHRRHTQHSSVNQAPPPQYSLSSCSFPSQVRMKRSRGTSMRISASGGTGEQLT